MVILSLKNRAFEPLSIELVFGPLYVVLKLPYESVAYTVAPPSLLFVCVPMPKIREPLRILAPAAETAGRSIRTPLLSCKKRATGFWTACAEVTVEFVQPVDVHV